jgi:hypothetical protein
MRKVKLFVLTVAALFAVKGLALAGAIGVPLDPNTFTGTVNLGLNGTNLTVDVNPVFNADGTISYNGVHVFGDGNRTSFNITANPDPNIVYGIVFGPTPGVGPNNYTFDFSQPFLGGPYDSLHNDFSGSATFSSPGTGGSVTGINVRADVNGVFAPGVDLLGFSCSSPSNTSIGCGAGSADANIPLVSAPGSISVHVEASLSGPNDVATFNGRVEISCSDSNTNCNPIPEPGTVMLLGSGLIGLAWLRWKQAR